MDYLYSILVIKGVVMFVPPPYEDDGGRILDQVDVQGQAQLSAEVQYDVFGRILTLGHMDDVEEPEDEDWN